MTNNLVQTFGFDPSKDLLAHLENRLEALEMNCPNLSRLKLSLHYGGGEFAAELSISSLVTKFHTLKTSHSLVDVVTMVFQEIENQIQHWRAVRYTNLFKADLHSA